MTTRTRHFLKGLANTHRLLVLCALAEGESSVSELIAATGIAPTSMSQHLAKLRALRLVAARRDGQSIRYRLASSEVEKVLTTLHGIYCATN